MHALSERWEGKPDCERRFGNRIIIGIVAGLIADLEERGCWLRRGQTNAQGGQKEWGCRGHGRTRAGDSRVLASGACCACGAVRPAPYGGRRHRRRVTLGRGGGQQGDHPGSNHVDLVDHGGKRVVELRVQVTRVDG